MQVYPAAGLVHYAKQNCPIFYIDPKPATIYQLNQPLEVVPKGASEGVAMLKDKLLAILKEK